MLKSDIDKSISTLINTIQECNIDSMLQTIIEGEGKVNTVEALKSYKQFIKFYQTYNEFEIKLLEVSGLGDLTQESLWSRFVKPEESDTPEVISDLRNSLQFLMNQLPKIQELRSADEDKIQAVIDAGKQAGVDYVPLSVVVIEEEELATPERLISMMDAIQGLYEVFGRMGGMPYQDLIVTSCDSGNDKVFNFLGSSIIIGGVRDIILSYWDRVVFYREDKKGEYVKLVTQTLPVIEVINKMEQDGKLEKEEAEILRRRVVTSMTKLSRAGITIPEMEEHAHQDPRELLRPDRKVLTQSIDPEEDLELSGEYPAVVEDEEEGDPDDFDVEEPAEEEPAVAEESPEEAQPEVEAEQPEPEPQPEPEVEEAPEPEVAAEPQPEPEVAEEPAPEPEPTPEPEQTAVKEEAPVEEPVQKAEEKPVDPFGNLDDSPSVTESFDEPAKPEPKPTPEPTTEPEPVEPTPPAPEPEVKVEPEVPATDNFEDSDAFGVPGEPAAAATAEPESAPAGEEEVKTDFTDLGEDIYTQAGVDDVEVILEDEPLSAPAAPAADGSADLEQEPVEQAMPATTPDEPEEAPAAEAPEEESETEAFEEEEDEASKKFDEEIDNVFERIAAGFLEMKKEEAEQENAKENSDDAEDDD